MGSLLIRLLHGLQRLPAFLAMAAMCSAWAEEQQPTWSISCYVDASALNVTRHEFESAIRRKLRALGDVTVGGPESVCRLTLVGLTLHEGPFDTHFVAVLVTYEVNTKWMTVPEAMHGNAVSQKQASVISDLLDSTEARMIKYFAILSGVYPHEISSRLVSAVDSQVFEEGRQFYALVRKARRQSTE